MKWIDWFPSIWTWISPQTVPPPLQNSRAFDPPPPPSPNPPGISNSLCGGGMDIFWNHTLKVHLTSRSITGQYLNMSDLKILSFLSIFFSHGSNMTECSAYRTGNPKISCWSLYFNSSAVVVCIQCSQGNWLVVPVGVSESVVAFAMSNRKATVLVVSVYCM